MCNKYAVKLWGRNGADFVTKNGRAMMINEIVEELTACEVEQTLKDTVAIAAIQGLVACGITLDTAGIVSTSLSIAREYMLQRSEQ